MSIAQSGLKEGPKRFPGASQPELLAGTGFEFENGSKKASVAPGARGASTDCERMASSLGRSPGFRCPHSEQSPEGGLAAAVAERAARVRMIANRAMIVGIVAIL